ncbi:MAG: hypothetical protein ABIS01_17055, partial [Ferruginibacter sp.]
EFSNNPQVTFFTYLQHIVFTYAGLAKGKWDKGYFSKPKVKKLDNYITKTSDGNISVDVYGTLDFLAENLSQTDQVEWAQYSKKEVAEHLKNN